jgi:predicted AAA+ superfamily ATPase
MRYGIRFLRGGYPELIAHPKIVAALWLSSYILTYLERDVRYFTANRRPRTISNIYKGSLPPRARSFLTLTSLSRDLGVAVKPSTMAVFAGSDAIRFIILRLTMPTSANGWSRLRKRISRM